MRLMSLCVVVVMASWLTGCGWFHRDHAKPAPVKVAPVTPVIVTPAQTSAAYVLLVNDSGRFVVLNFPGGQVPADGKILDIYRNGLKTAEVKTSKFRQENNVTADILTGDVRKGDEARGE